MGFENCRAVDLSRRTVSVQSVTLVYEFCVTVLGDILCCLSMWPAGRPVCHTVQQYTSNFLEEKICLKTVSLHIVGSCETETTCSAVYMILNSSDHKTVSTVCNVTLWLLSTTERVPATPLYNKLIEPKGHTFFLQKHQHFWKRKTL
jgi:hypothetical protein